MKQSSAFALLLALFLTVSQGCIEPEPDPPITGSEDPDLYWLDYQNVYNPCTGQYQYLNISRFFWVYNLNNPNYPPQVLLYYDDQSGLFTDCLGFIWFILPGSQLISNRYMGNKPGGSTARTPSARAHITVRDGGGQTTEETGDLVTFNDLPPGQTATLPTTITIGQNNTTYLMEYSADPISAIAESNESNNVSSDGFSRSDQPSSVSFSINVPSELELAKIKTRYILYRNGQIEIRN
ncbi:MAG: CARDB domain-containing protein [Saprospiraceae bacterium]|nr:CARDB domain-containing protein [Saprospiraceae bacterium]